jgi:hypothetical protein
VVAVVCDNVIIHHSKIVQRWLASHPRVRVWHGVWALTFFPGAALRLFPRVWPSGGFYWVTSLPVTSARPGRLFGR